MAESPSKATQVAPPEVDEWAATTTAGMLAGMIYGGFREAATVHLPSQDAILPTNHFQKVDNPEFPQSKRSAMETRFLRITRASIVGGSQLGTLAGLFSGIQLSLAVYREQRDTLNVVAAGATTAAVLGLSMPGSGIARLQGAGRGALVGALLAFPLGLLQTSLQSMLPPPAKDNKAVNAMEVTDGVDEAIRRMERHFQQRADSESGVPQNTDASSQQQ